MQGGKQQLSLSSGCASLIGIPVHELMHAIGYMHEQSRPDRDQYITINWENMNSMYQSQFSVCNNCDVQDTEYDYSSVMHYPSSAFSKNGLDTIVRNDGEDLVSRVYDLGLGLSCLDI